MQTLRQDAQAILDRALADALPDSAVRRASSTVYDGFLKASGDENGVKSYGMVVDLLTVYYRDAALGA